jgi:hypothetical protein
VKSKTLMFAAMCTCCVSLCHAADSPWNGTWKLNEVRSKLTGSMDTVSQGPDGKYTVTSSGLTFTFGCDGANYPLPGGHEISCTRNGDQALHFVARAGGDELGQIDRTLSDGGKTMTVVDTGKAPDGTPFRDTEVYRKVAAGSGDAWTGQWQNSKVQIGTSGTAVIQMTGDSIHFEYPMDKSSLTAKLDGTPATRQEPHPEEGMTISLTAAGPLTLHEVDKLNDTVLERDTLTVSPDGKTMSIEVQRTGDKVKQLYVYEKQ